MIRRGTARRLGLKPPPTPVVLSRVTDMGDDGVGVYYVVAGVNGRSWAQDPNGRAVHGLTFIVGDGQIRDTRKTAFGPWVKVRGGRL